jgi:hypothetical protein
MDWKRARCLELGAFERIILRTIYGPVKKKDTWQARYNRELGELYQELAVVARLQWLGHTMGMGVDGMPKKILLEQPGGYREV